LGFFLLEKRAGFPALFVNSRRNPHQRLVPCVLLPVVELLDWLPVLAVVELDKA